MALLDGAVGQTDQKHADTATQIDLDANGYGIYTDNAGRMYFDKHGVWGLERRVVVVVFLFVSCCRNSVDRGAVNLTLVGGIVVVVGELGLLLAEA